MDLRAHSKGRAFFRAATQKTAQVSNLFWCGILIFYNLTTSELLLQATKPNIILTLSARSYTQTNSDYRCLLFPACPYRISLFCTHRTIVLWAGNFCPWLVLLQRLLLFCLWEVIKVLAHLMLKREKTTQSPTKPNQTKQTTKHQKVK